MNRLQVAGGILALALVLAICRRYLSRWRNQVEAKQRGCGPLPDAGSQGPLGALGIYQILKALYRKTNSESLVQWIDSSGNDIHTCRYNLMGNDIIMTRDPENVRAMLVTQVNDYDLGDDRMAIIEPLLGTSFVNSRGEAWKHSRALIRPQFTRGAISDLGMEERHLNDVWLLLDKELGGNGWTGTVNLQKIFFNLTLSTSVDFLLGHKANLHTWQAANGKSGDAEAARLREHFRAGAVWIYIRFLFGKKYRMVPSRSLQYHCGKIRDFFRPFIRKTLDRLDENGAGDMDSQGRFILLEELAKGTQDPVELENEIVGLMVAGQGTTAALLVWTMYFLARDPRVFNKLRAAVISQFGLTPESITLHGLESSEYLRLVTRESLRMAPVIPSITRNSLIDTTLPRGGGKDGMDPVYVPKNTEIGIAFFPLFHRVDIWGLDVEEFRPERWEDRPVGFEFCPFSAGRRKCIGQQFALAEVHYVLVRFLQRYDQLANMEPPGPIRYNQALITKNGKGCKVKLHRA